MELNNYPRIEIYSEVNKSEQNAGNDKWVSSDNKVIHGGKRDYNLYIKRQTYLMNEKQKAMLLNTSLNWLPYFGIKKDNITLKQYFDAITNTNRSILYKLLPENLNFLLLQKEIDKNYLYYNTMHVYENASVHNMVVVWLDENTWFIDNLYYSSNDALKEYTKEGKEDIIAKGSFKDFLNLSSIFQYKLTEGFSNLKYRRQTPTIPLEEIVLGISLSPGMPNTISYDIKVMGDRTVISSNIKLKNKIDTHKLTTLLLKAKSFDWQSKYANDLTPFAHDKQILTISVWVNGILYRVSNPYQDKDSSFIEFVKMVEQELFSIK
ncbi:hypothetical protein AD998_11610 [bacterium 336/3]|nr:hypothetical protein AD998_11610 [bacterium 336/3]